MIRRLFRLVVIAALTTVLFLLGCQSRMIYYPRSYEPADLAALATAKGAELTFETAQGSQAAFYLPARDMPAGAAPDKVWLCFGGNGSLALDWRHFMGRWDGRCGYLLIDYPGYGKCQGSPNPATIAANTRGAVAALAGHLKLPEADLQPRLAVIGHSLGAAVALMAAEEWQARQIVLIAPFTSLADMGNKVLFWPLGYLTRHRYDNRALVRQALARNASIILIHGDEDEVIPFAMSQELQRIDPQHITLHLIKGAGHNDILDGAGKVIAAAMQPR